MALQKTYVETFKRSSFTQHLFSAPAATISVFIWCCCRCEPKAGIDAPDHSSEELPVGGTWHEPLVKSHDESVTVGLYKEPHLTQTTCIKALLQVVQEVLLNILEVLAEILGLPLRSWERC